MTELQEESMKIKYLLVVTSCIFITGCGDIEWFPENPAFTNNSSNTTTSPLQLTKAYSPAAILADQTSTLTFTITNATGNPAQTGMGFVDQLDSSLTLTKGSSTCGADFSIQAPNKVLLAGGQLAAGTPSCTMTVIVGVPDPGIEGSFTNKSSDVSSLQGGLVNGVTDQTLKIFPSKVVDSTGEVTASKIVVTETTASNANVRTFLISVEVANARDAGINAGVDVTAVDADGNQVTSGGFAITNTLISEVAAQATAVLTSNPPVDIPIADAAKIRFWRILGLEAI